MPTYKELLKQRQALDQKLSAMHAGARAAAIAEIHRLIDAHGLTARDLRPERVMPASTHAPGYRDPRSGRTWSGEGPPPRWLGTMKRIF